MPAVYQPAVDQATIDPQRMAAGQAYRFTLNGRAVHAVKHEDGTIDLSAPDRDWHIPSWIAVGVALPLLLWVAAIAATLAASHRG